MAVPLLSVVIPVYNTETFVGECLDSVCCAAEAIEIIIVNDGSTDASRTVLAAHARRRPEIRVIDICNSGPSVARNVGMSEARGRYVLFLDSDDFLAKGAVEELLRTLKTHELDCLFFAATIRYDVPQTSLKVRLDYDRPAPLCDQVMSGPEFFAICQKTDSYVVQPCLYVFRRSCARHIAFHPGIHHEDNLFTTELLLCGGLDRTMCSAERYYIRRVRRDSITTSRVSLKDVRDLHAVLTRLLAIHRQGRVPPEARRGFAKFINALAKFKLSMLISLFGVRVPYSIRSSSIKILMSAPLSPGSVLLMLCFACPELLMPLVFGGKHLRKGMQRLGGASRAVRGKRIA